MRQIEGGCDNAGTDIMVRSHICELGLGLRVEERGV